MTKSFSLELISRILTNIKLFLGIHLMESKKKNKMMCHFENYNIFQVFWSIFFFFCPNLSQLIF
jgi:hypothetical protein